MVKPKGWGGVKPYWWCDNPQTRAVELHLWNHLIHHPENGIYIKGVKKGSPESIELNTISGSARMNINTTMSDSELLLETVESIRLIMDNAEIDGTLFTYVIEEHFKNTNTYNLQYKWQQLEKKSKHSEH